MFREIIFCAFVFCGVQRSESTITGWTGDATIGAATGPTTLTTPLPETSAVGATVVSLTATSDGTVTYTVTGTPAVVTIDANTGVVTLSAQVDYETNTNLEVVITATDADGTGVATVTVPIGNVDPTATTQDICAVDGTGPGEKVGTVSATGVTAYSTTDTNFDVDQTSGDLKTAANLAPLAMATTATYTVIVTGTDSGEGYTITVTVTVAAECSGKEKFAATFASLFLSLLAYTLFSL